MQIRIIKGSIFRLKYVDAIVNITNRHLNSGYVIDKELHKREDLNKLASSIPYKVASAVIADAAGIESKKVIHSVFPDNITAESKQQIRVCFESIFKVSEENQIKSIALPLTKYMRNTLPKSRPGPASVFRLCRKARSVKWKS